MDKVDYYITDDKLENRRNGVISRRLRRRGKEGGMWSILPNAEVS